MRVLIQDARRSPRDWRAIEPLEWAALPKRPAPGPGDLGGQDNRDGWVSELNCQGVHFNGFDHYAVEVVFVGAEEGVRITGWSDDPDDWPVGERHARIWTLLPLAPDPALGFAINTRQAQAVYAEGARFSRLEANRPQNTTVRPWSEFVPPPESITRHGVRMTDAKWAEHREATGSFQDDGRELTWMHWVDHLPESETELDRFGRRVLREQRAQGRYQQASRTITYYQRDTNRDIDLIYIALHQDALETSTGTSATETATFNANHLHCWSFSTPANEPNSADWPNGSYRIQVNVSALSAGAQLHIGSFTNNQDGFTRVSSDLASELEDPALTSSAITTTGLSLRSFTWDPSAGAAGDRLHVGVWGQGDSHGDAATLTLNTTDSFVDGPWTGGGQTESMALMTASAAQPAVTAAIGASLGLAGASGALLAANPPAIGMQMGLGQATAAKLEATAALSAAMAPQAASAEHLAATAALVAALGPHSATAAHLAMTVTEAQILQLALMLASAAHLGASGSLAALMGLPAASAEHLPITVSEGQVLQMAAMLASASKFAAVAGLNAPMGLGSASAVMLDALPPSLGVALGLPGASGALLAATLALVADMGLASASASHPAVVSALVAALALQAASAAHPDMTVNVGSPGGQTELMALMTASAAILSAQGSLAAAMAPMPADAAAPSATASLLAPLALLVADARALDAAGVSLAAALATMSATATLLSLTLEGEQLIPPQILRALGLDAPALRQIALDAPRVRSVAADVPVVRQRGLD